MGLRFEERTDILTAVAVSVAATAWLLIAPDVGSPIRILIALLAALFTPGYVVTALLYPRRDDIDQIDRVVISLGLSVTAIALSGYIANFTPWGIRPLPMSIGLTLFAIVVGAAALLRRRALSSIERPTPFDRRGIRRAGPLLLSAALAVAAVVGLTTLLRPTGPNLEFYVLGNEGGLESFPQRVVAGAPLELQVGVFSPEATGELRLTGEVRDVPDAGGETPRVLTRSSLDLAPLTADERREFPIRIDTPQLIEDAAPRRAEIHLQLFRVGDTEPFRRLRLDFTLTPGGGARPPSVAASARSE